MNLIFFLLSSSWRMVAIAIVTGFLSGGSSAALIALISRAAAQDPGASLSTTAWAFVGLAIIALITSIIAQIMLIRLSQNAVLQLRMRLSRQILDSELSHLEELGNPRLLATLTEDVQAVANGVHQMPFLFINLAIVLGCMTYITWLSRSVILMVIGLAVVAIASCQWMLNRGKKMLALARADQDILFKHLGSITAGIKELKLHYKRRQFFLEKQLLSTVNHFRHHNVVGLSFFAATSSWGQLIFFFALGFVIFVLPNFMAISPQTLSGYILTFTYLVLPMDSIISKLPLFSRANIALEKIESLGLSLINRAEAPTVPPHSPLRSDTEFAPNVVAVRPRAAESGRNPRNFQSARERRPSKGMLTKRGEQGVGRKGDLVTPLNNSSWHYFKLDNITHTYRTDDPGSHFILGPVNLKFSPQEIVFVIGGNGSGKSTLAKLITGLYIPESGEITLNGEPITEQNREWYRQHFAVVFSDFYLFEDLLGLDDSNLDIQAQKYLELLQLDHKVQVKQGKLSTTALSQGQRKRLALLTAYLEDRPIYLFDEWAADQDPFFKEIFYSKLLPDLRDRGKTVLVISHDDHYFHVADRIIKLDFGQVEYDKDF